MPNPITRTFPRLNLAQRLMAHHGILNVFPDMPAPAGALALPQFYGQHTNPARNADRADMKAAGGRRQCRKRQQSLRAAKGVTTWA